MSGSAPSSTSASAPTSATPKPSSTASSASSTDPAARQPPPADPHASRLSRARINLAYLALGSGAAVAPNSIATRSMLTTARYAIRYAIRRLVRYAKYAAVGGIVALIGGGLLGTLGSGLAFFAAPGVFGGMAIGIVTAAVKFGWRHRGNHFRGGYFEGMRRRAEEGHDGAADEGLDSGERKAEREMAARAENRRRREDVWQRI